MEYFQRHYFALLVKKIMNILKIDFYKLALTVLCNLFKAIKKTATISGGRKSNGKNCEFVGVWRLILVFQSIDY